MLGLDWKSVWEKTVKNNRLFPHTLKNNELSIACPTRFSKYGNFNITVKPSFTDESITLEMQIFNDNVSLKDFNFTKIAATILKMNSKSSYEALVPSLVAWESNNKLMDRYEINSEDFESEDDAIKGLVDYLNNKATSSGREFDDTLDSITDECLAEVDKVSKEESLIDLIRQNRIKLFENVKAILSKRNFICPKNESLDDSVVSFYKDNGDLAAVVSLTDNTLVIDLSQDISSKINLIQPDENIEAEILSDIDDVNLLADQKEQADIEELKQALSKSKEQINDEDETLSKLERKVTKLESYFISRFKSRLY